MNLWREAQSLSAEAAMTLLSEYNENPKNALVELKKVDSKAL